MIPFLYSRPETIDAAVALLDEHGPDARVEAGGTDLIVGLRKGKFRAAMVVDVKRVRELDATIDESGGTFRIGALATIADICRDAGVNRHFPALVEAGSIVGSIQIRNRATLPGNICTASPAADTVPVLLVYGATVVLFGPDGERRLPLSEFFVGPGKTVKHHAEIVTAVEIPVPSGRNGTAFERLTRRLGVDLATVNLACRVDQDYATTMAFGAVAPTPVVVSDESGRFAAPDASEDERTAALTTMLERTSPITDVRGGRDYRAAMLVEMGRIGLGHALERLAAI